MANPTTVRYSVIKEATAGVTPATPAFKRFAHVTGDNLQYSSETLQSEIIMNSGASAGMNKVGYSVKGSLKTHLSRSDSTDALIESAFGGVFSGNSLKAGTAAVPLTIEKTFVSDGTTHYRQFKGCQVAKFGVSGEAKGNITASFDIVGMAAPFSSTMITGATYTSSAATKLLHGGDVTISINGVTASYTSLEFSIESERAPVHVFGSTDAVEVGTSGIRKTMLNLTVLRKSYALETALMTDTPVSVTITFGTGANGYSITLPAAVSEVPQDSEDGPSMLAQLNFWGGEDGTAATDAVITKLS